jgi:hypothetical protein
MKQNILKIEQLAALLFADKQYNEFINNIDNNQINAARLMIDIEIEQYDLDNHIDSHFEHSIADKLQDLVMDLIINEIDGERENKQIKSSIG